MTVAGDSSRWPARCTTESLNDVLVYHLFGDLDYGATDTLAFDKPLAGFHAVVVDLAEVTFFTSTALNGLLGLRLRAEPLGIPIHLCKLPAATARVLELTEATSLFRIHPDLETALAAAQPPPDQRLGHTPG
ncbi:STAS domain-containing protein [Streptacidiphilus neutrinimicus]|uniref:STAS domain-containing protein n=1 Tax=Streptacidiphilus neutrinimicus TaxID=105420 RepID=UPI000694CD30|nr:STAS domain-containing protein [Streptacidiphilus neutrinimicus]